MNMKSAILATVIIALLQLGTPAQSLREVFGKYFKIGASLNSAQFSGRDPRGEAIIKTHFNTISPENVLVASCSAKSTGDLAPACSLRASVQK